MKLSKLLSLSLLVVGLFTAGCFTVPPAADSADYAGFDYVTNIDGLKKDAIYDGVELWIAENFKSAKHVIDFENKEQGIIIGNGVIPGIILDTGMVKMPQDASFKMKVEVRDEKIRLTFSQFQIVNRENSSLFKPEVTQINQRLAKFGEEIARYLKTRKDSKF